MTEEDWVHAARLALPEHAHLTGISRIRLLGLDFGPVRPLHFVLVGDLHLAFEGVFLHRTKKLPPLDDIGVSVEAAFIAYCVQARVIDAIKVGDWLLHGGHLDLNRLQDLAVAEQWRDGADETLWVMNFLDKDSWSLKESETRALLVFAGLPRPRCNLELEITSGRRAVGDLVYEREGVVVEFEGRQHQEDRGQYAKDVDRYADFRDSDYRYVQVTDEKLRTPRAVVMAVHRELCKGGYDGPAPRFGEQWKLLFAKLRVAVGPRDNWTRSA